MRLSKLALAAALPPVLLITCEASVRSAAPQPPQRAVEHHRPVTAARPTIMTRHTWGADEHSVRERPTYTHAVRAVFLHHTDHDNDYDCADVPRLLRILQTQHVQRGWDDVGYNFVIDRCGTIYEGRSGGASRAVKGAHTGGFNDDTAGIAFLGTFDEGQKVPDKALAAAARLIAWKLKPGADPKGWAKLRSESDSSRVEKGDTAKFHTIAGHRDAYETDCPGKELYDRLPELRSKVAELRADAARRQRR
ncbi:N-acetylmuramoyl-L-alanine amidase [Streptomyces xiaopingdaonensis]|uniref:N-acetylmuramoyl-L-alanine amidase n=1 Tax=Streptomyces xiaopingdaonensis TaxID=1565415 RepID=UPI0003025022|nr:N-acetylmuramoyl-L-alanine amidase [Streptomyces xiaopingdaonensis]